MSIGLPSTKGVLRVVAPPPSKPVLVLLVDSPSSAASVTCLERFNYSIVLRLRSLSRRSSSRVEPFLFAKLETKPWMRSMSWTWRLIYFWRTLISLSIWILRLWRPVSIFASSWSISFLCYFKRFLRCFSAFACLKISTLSASCTSNSLSSLR